MAPDKVPNPFPAQCALDRSQIKSIADTVGAINSKVDALLSYEGPISVLRERMRLVEKLADHTSERVDVVERQERDRDREVNKLAVRVASWSSGITASLTAAVFWISTWLRSL